METLLKIAETLLKNGLSLTSAGLIILYLLRFKPIQDWLIKHAPKRFRRADKLSRLESKVDLLLRKEGLEWPVENSYGKNELGVTSGRIGRLESQRVDISLADNATSYTTSTGKTSPLQRRSMDMKNKLLSRKFLMAVISAGLIIANDGLELGLDQNTIIAFGTIVVGWIVGESATDVAKAKNGGTNDELSKLDAIRKDSE